MPSFNNSWDDQDFGLYSDDTGGYGGSAPSASTATPANGEQAGADSELANAWWKSIHPDMNGEGMGGLGSEAYPTPPSWFDPHQLTSMGDSGDVGEYGNPANFAGGMVDFYTPGGVLKPDQLGSLNGRTDLTNYQKIRNYDKTGSAGYDVQAFDSTGKPVGDSSFYDTSDQDQLFGYILDAAAGALGGFAGGEVLGATGYGAGGTADAAFGDLGAGTSGVAPGWAAGAAKGAGAGFMGTAAQTGDFLQSIRGAATGGLTGGFAGGIDPAGALGVDDPNYTRPINNAAATAGKAAITGQPIGKSVLGSLENSGLSAGLQGAYNGVKSMGDYTSPFDEDYGNEGRNYPQAPDPSANVLGYSRPADPNFNQSSWMPGNTPGADQASWMSPDNGRSVSPQFPGMGMDTAPQEQSNPYKASILANRPKAQSFGGGAAAPGGFDNMAGNLMQLYQSYKNKKQYSGLANNLSSLYGQDSPYAQQLKQTLLRQDAAAGRRSQVGPRSVELQARLADMNSRNAPELAKLYGASQNNNAQMLQSLLRMGMGGPNGGGGFDMLRGAAGQARNWWDNQQSPTPAGNTSFNNNDYAPGD